MGAQESDLILLCAVQSHIIKHECKISLVSLILFPVWPLRFGPPFTPASRGLVEPLVLISIFETTYTWCSYVPHLPSSQL